MDKRIYVRNVVKGMRKGIAFVLLLAMILGSMTVGLVLPDRTMTTYASSSNLATLRIEGLDGQTLLSETTGEIVDGVTTIGAFVANVCADNNLDFQLGGSNFPATIGGISGSWMTQIDDSSNVFNDFNKNFTNVTLSNGTSIVLYPWVNGQAYSYFEVGNPGIIQVGDYFQASVSLTLHQSSWSDPTTIVSGATVTAIDATTYPAYPTVVTRITNSEGKVTLPLWAGTYLISAEKVSGSSIITKPYAKVIVGNDGSTTIISPKTPDVGLQKLDINLPSATIHVNSQLEVGNPYIYTSEAGSGVTVTAVAASGNATIRVSQGGISTTLSGSACYLDNSLSKESNQFVVTISNGEFSKDYIFYVNRIAAAVDESQITGVINRMIYATSAQGLAYYGNYYPEYVTAISAQGSTLSETDKQLFLNKVLDEVRSNNGATSYGRIGKIAAALTAVGIDPRQVPDVSASVASGTVIDLISRISGHVLTGGDAYNAPYMLIGYDSGNYSIASGTDRTTLIDFMLDKQSADGGFASGWSDADTTAQYILAFAPYYNASGAINGVSASTVALVKSSVDRAITYLLTQQGEYGCFKGFGGYTNSNTTSIVISALEAINKNPHADPFRKSSYSALQGLLTYQTDYDLIGITDSMNYNNISNAQGFMALVGYQIYRNGGSGNVYQVSGSPDVYTQWPSEILKEIKLEKANITYKAGDAILDSQLTVSAVYSSSGGIRTTILSKGNGTTGYQITGSSNLKAGGNSISVSYMNQSVTYIITALNSDGTNPNIASVDVTVKSNNATIASQNDLVIQADVTTALDVLKSTLNSNQIQYTVSGGIYVSSIDGISEFSQGPYSGWLYSVNGVTPPTTSANDFTLQAGDVVRWYFSSDFTKDSSTIAWAAANLTVAAGAVEAKVDSAGNAKATIASKDLQSAIDSKGGLEISSDVASIKFDQTCLSRIGNQISGDLSITMTKVDTSKMAEADKMVLGSRPIYEFSVKDGTSTISEFGGNVSVSIAYELDADEDPTSVLIYYINKDGKLELVKNSRYNETTKRVEFTTNHFSIYAVGYHPVTFQDTKTHWAKDSIHFLASRGIIKGMTSDAFWPNKTVSRAEFVTILANKAGIDLANYQTTSQGYADIKSSDWFTKAVLWASDQGIVNGRNSKDGRLQFDPNGKISRQDMAVILSRYLTNVDKTTLATPNAAITFADQSKIASYASTAVKSMQQAGILHGKTATTFAPCDSATRAEAGKMITEMMKITF